MKCAGNSLLLHSCTVLFSPSNVSSNGGPQGCVRTHTLHTHMHICYNPHGIHCHYCHTACINTVSESAECCVGSVANWCPLPPRKDLSHSYVCSGNHVCTAERLLHQPATHPGGMQYFIKTATYDDLVQVHCYVEYKVDLVNVRAET